MLEIYVLNDHILINKKKYGAAAGLLQQAQDCLHAPVLIIRIKDNSAKQFSWDVILLSLWTIPGRI